MRIFRLQFFGIFRSDNRPAGTFAGDFSLGNFCVRSSALKVNIGSFHLAIFVCERSLDMCFFGVRRLEIVVLESVL